MLYKKIAFWIFLLVSGIGLAVLSNSELLIEHNIEMELLMLAMTFFVYPLFYLIAVYPSKRKIWYLLAPVGFGVLLGSFILDDTQKHYWRYFEAIRYAIIPLFVLFEVYVLYLVVSAIRKMSRSNKSENEMLSKVEEIVGSGTASKILVIELLMWYYAFIAKKGNPLTFSGQEHFTYYHKDNYASDQFGFIVVILIGIIPTHLLLHFVWSPTAATVITCLTIYSSIWLYGEYKATLMRPISINGQDLDIRFGLMGNEKIPISTIERVEIINHKVPRSKDIIRHRGATSPNIKISLKPDTKLIGTFGVERIYSSVYLAIDAAQSFKKSVDSKMECIA